ncbi:MAG: hypothetical protein HFE78_08700 [Clostridiales bacterium]|nr:hypothetical protein [Clostridiales bacterium]
MHVVIISGAARTQSRSNTAKIIAALCEGLNSSGNTSEIWYLSDRKQWKSAKTAFEENQNILFALPLYVENVPGIMLEFLAGLSAKERPGTRISFLLQGGFPEVSQGRCCEEFLKTLPAQLGCGYGGTFIKGDMFGLSLMGEKIGGKLLQPFIEIGRLFGENGVFRPETIETFSTPEYLSEKQIRMSNGPLRYVQRFAMWYFAKRLGCKTKLEAKPFCENELQEAWEETR